MITTEQYNHIITELLDELPEEFFRELSGGVIVSEAMVIPDYAQGNDLYTMGQYQIVEFSVMSSGTIWNSLPESTIHLPWRLKMKG